MALILEAIAKNGSRRQTSIQELEFIEKGLWYDEEGKEKINVLRYGMKKVRFRVFFTNLSFQYLTQYKLGLCIDGIYYPSSEQTYKLVRNGNLNYIDHLISITGRIFFNTTESIVSLSCCLTLKSGKKIILPYSKMDFCRVHFVIFVPEIMKYKGWNMAFKFQEYWFNNKANSNCEKCALTDAVDIHDILSFPRVRKAYNQLFQRYKTPKAKKILIGQIQKMINNKELLLPKNKNESIPFGNFSNCLINDVDGSLKTKMHQYQYQLFNYDASPLLDPLDDFYGAFGQRTFYLAAAGTISKLEEGYKIRVEKIAVYLKDNFDFQQTTELMSTNSLGVWSYKAMNVERNPVKSYINSNISLCNEDYRKYRKETGYGCDFNVYSTHKVHNLFFEIVTNDLYE